MVNSRCIENDRSYEILLYFFDLYNKFSERVVLLCGNHEDAKRKINGNFNLIGWNKNGWKTKYWSNNLNLCLNSLPLCCEILKDGKKYFAVHGNVSADFIDNPGSIENFKKPEIHENDPEDFKEGLNGRFGLLNNHLCTENDAKPTGYYGEYINMESVAKFCQSRGYAGLFRGHDPYYKNIQREREGIFAYTIHSNGYYPPNNPNPAQDPRVAIIKSDGTVELSYFDRQQ